MEVVFDQMHTQQSTIKTTQSSVKDPQQQHQQHHQQVVTVLYITGGTISVGYNSTSPAPHTTTSPSSSGKTTLVCHNNQPIMKEVKSHTCGCPHHCKDVPTRNGNNQLRGIKRKKVGQSNGNKREGAPAIARTTAPPANWW
jgi:hypothetical protein